MWLAAASDCARVAGLLTGPGPAPCACPQGSESRCIVPVSAAEQGGNKLAFTNDPNLDPFGSVRKEQLQS